MFKEDLHFGLEAEQKVAEFFLRFLDVKQSVGYDKGKDMTVEGKFEVKSDRLATKTGNYAIELRCNGKLSGLCTTKATGWVLCTEEGCWLIGTKVLERFVKDIGYRNNQWHTTKAGDGKNAEVILVPYGLIKSFWKIV